MHVKAPGPAILSELETACVALRGQSPLDGMSCSHLSNLTNSSYRSAWELTVLMGKVAFPLFFFFFYSGRS